MNDTSETVEQWFYYPLRRQGDRFVEAPESLILGLDKPAVPDLDEYLSDYERIEADVELAGSSYRAEVYVPNEKEKLAYVVANSKGVPRGIPEGVNLRIELLHEYLIKLYEKTLYSEAIAPEQASYLESEFMVPSFFERGPRLDDARKDRTWEELKRRPRAVLFGEPGSGKTTCFRKLAMEFATRRALPSSHQSIPVYVQLRGWGHNLGVLDNIKYHLHKQNEDWLAANVEELCDAGRLTFLLDGLDELPQGEYLNGVAAILNVAKKYPKIGLFISTRNTGYDWFLPGFSYFEIRPFPESRIKEWLCQRLYDDQEKSWTLFYSHLRESPDLLKLVGNPLMLSIALYLYSYNSLLPYNRSTLLEKFVDAFVGLWDTVRGVNRSKELWASSNYKLATLCRLAYTLNKSDKTSFSSQEFIEWERGRTDEEVADRILPLLGAHTGLIQNESYDGTRWRFTHKTITSYLAARYLVQRTEDTSSLLGDWLSDENRQDIWTYACGITQDATHLLKLVIEKADLSSTSRAVLLAKALSQNITLDRHVITESADAIVGAIEELTQELEILETPIPSENEPLLWSVSLCRSDGTQWLRTLHGDNLRKLFRTIYGARSGSIREALTTAFGKSEFKVVSALSGLLRVEGRYQDAVGITIEGREVLSIGVYGSPSDLESDAI